MRPDARADFEVHNVARRVQDIVREYALRTLGTLRPVEIVRGMTTQPPYVLDFVHIGAHIGTPGRPNVESCA